MYVVIAGGGRIGRYISEDLVDKGHEVTVIERIPARCEQLVAHYPVLVIEGDACDVQYLEQAHLDRADVFLATTHEDDDNLVACQLARIEFGVKRTIARVNTPKNVEIFQKLGIEAVSSTQLISELLEHEFTVGELIHLVSLRGGRVLIVEVKIPGPEDPRAPAPRHVQDLGLPYEVVLAAIFRGEETLIPRGTTEVRAGDDVVVLTTPELEEKVEQLLLGDGS